MFVLAGIALLNASSPVLGTLVSGEYSTAFAVEANHGLQLLIDSGNDI